MWIERTIEPLLREVAAERPAVVVTGARQAGKTSLLEHLFPGHAYVTLDIPNLADKAETSGEQFLRDHPAPLIVDEVQYAPQLLRHVKAAIDRHRADKGQYLLTGSQKFQLMRGVTESLAGRVAVITVHSLSAAEIETWAGAPLEGERLLQAMFDGGYAELHAGGIKPERFYGDYLATYLERDVRHAVQVRNLRDFDRFMRLLALRNGRLVAASALANDVGVSAATIKSWLDVLEGSNVIALLPPYHRNLGKRLVKTPKLYFLDTGLACYLAGLRSPKELATSALLGAMFETYAAGQLLRYFANRGESPRLCFYRDHHGREVDFLLPVGEKVHAMECKWSERPSPVVPGFVELQNLLGPGNLLSKTIITPQRGYYVNSEGLGRGDVLNFRYLLHS